MARATWNDTVLAESDVYEVVEGNVYSPPDSINREYFSGSDHTTRCPWKGTANYLTAEVNGEKFTNAGWYYADPSSAAANIKGYVAFYGPVQVEA